jgi:hypothetical protein
MVCTCHTNNIEERNDIGENEIKGGERRQEQSCLLSPPFHLIFSYPSFLTTHSPIHPIFFLFQI